MNILRLNQQSPATTYVIETPVTEIHQLSFEKQVHIKKMKNIRPFSNPYKVMGRSPVQRIEPPKFNDVEV